MTKTRMKLLSIECPTDERSYHYYDDLAWYAARLHYEVAQDDEDLTNALLNTLHDDEAIFEVDPALEAADPDAHDEVHSLGLSLYVAVAAIEHAARGCAHDWGVLRTTHKLTKDDIVTIRERYAAGDDTQVNLADEFGVCQPTIGDIVRGDAWPHVGGPISHTDHRGERHHGSKLTKDEVVEIRERYATGEVSQYTLADEYDVTHRTIGSIVVGDTWPHVGGPISDRSENRGERHPMTTLTKDEVVEIRERYAAGGVSQRDLATEYGVAHSTVRVIVTGDTWADAPGPIKSVDYDEPGEVSR